MTVFIHHTDKKCTDKKYGIGYSTDTKYLGGLRSYTTSKVSKSSWEGLKLYSFSLYQAPHSLSQLMTHPLT